MYVCMYVCMYVSTCTFKIVFGYGSDARLEEGGSSGLPSLISKEPAGSDKLNKSVF